MSIKKVYLINQLPSVNIPSGLHPMGAYAAGTDYAVGDSVDYLGSSYVMFVDAAAGTVPTDTTKWQVLANKGEPNTVTDTNSIDITLTGGTDIKADLVIQDTATVDLTVDGSGLKADVIDASVSNAKLANMATKTYKGRTSALTGVPEDVAVATLKTDLSLGNVDNTSDADKPISTLTQTALNAKQDTLVSATNIKTINSTSLLGAGDLVLPGTGDVVAPATNTADYIPQWNGANSKTLKDGLAVPAGGLAGLTALSGKASTALDNLASVAMNASLQFDNTAARTFDIAPTANTVVGRALTVSAGSTVTGGTADMAGGNLTLNSGLGKGTGASSIIFQTGRTLTTGSTLQTLTTAMTILGSGYVGIGTTSPGASLEIAAPTSNIPGLTLNRTHGTSALNMIRFYQDGVQMGALGSGGSGGDLSFASSAGKDFIFSNASVELARFRSNNNVTFVTAGGNVGIGTTSPATKCDIAGSMQVSSAVALSLGGYVRTYAEATGTPSGTTTYFDIAVNVPTGCKLLGAQLRVDTALTAGETWSAAYITGSTTALAAVGTAVAKNTKVNKMHVDEITTATTLVRITRDVGNFTDATGVIRAIVYYETMTTMGTAA